MLPLLRSLLILFHLGRSWGQNVGTHIHDVDSAVKTLGTSEMTAAVQTRHNIRDDYLRLLFSSLSALWLISLSLLALTPPPYTRAFSGFLPLCC